MRVSLPPSATALGAADDRLLVGTRDLGVARYRDGDRQGLTDAHQQQEQPGHSVAVRLVAGRGNGRKPRPQMTKEVQRTATAAR